MKHSFILFIIVFITLSSVSANQYQDTVCEGRTCTTTIYTNQIKIGDEPLEEQLTLRVSGTSVEMLEQEILLSTFSIKLLDSQDKQVPEADYENNPVIIQGKGYWKFGFNITKIKNSGVIKNFQITSTNSEEKTSTDSLKIEDYNVDFSDVKSIADKTTNSVIDEGSKGEGGSKDSTLTFTNFTITKEGNLYIDPVIELNSSNPGMKDTWINYQATTTNYDDDDVLRVGTGSGELKWAGLMYFNLSSINAGVINSATLYLHTATEAGVESNENIGIFRMLKGWRSNETTYEKNDSGTNWAASGLQSGTDYYATASNTFKPTRIVDGAANFIDVASLITTFLIPPNPNHGFLLKCTDCAAEYYTFHSKDYSNPTYHPKLTINYDSDYRPLMSSVVCTPVKVYETDDILCNSTFTDQDEDSANITVDWYVDGTLKWSQIFTNQANGTVISSQFNNTFFNFSQKVNSSFIAWDGYLNSTKVWSNTITIQTTEMSVSPSSSVDPVQNTTRWINITWAKTYDSAINTSTITLIVNNTDYQFNITPSNWTACNALNTSCNFTFTIPLQYYYNPGLFNINASVYANNGSLLRNDDYSFTYNELIALKAYNTVSFTGDLFNKLNYSSTTAYLKNEGNVNLNITLDGEDLEGLNYTSINLSISKFKFDDDEDASDGTLMTGAFQEFKNLLNPTKTVNVTYYLMLYNVTSQSYNGTFTYSASKG